MEKTPAEEPQAARGLAFQLGRLRRLRLLMAGALALLLLPLAALFFVRSFVIEVQPEAARAELETQTLEGAGFGLFQRWFFVGSGVKVRLAAPGFRPEELSVQAPLEKGRYEVVLQPLPTEPAAEAEASPPDLGAMVPEPPLAALDIRSRPSPAAVFLNGDYAGTTPFATQVKPNARYAVKVRKHGFNARTVTVSPKPGEAVSRLLELSRKTVRALISANVPAEILVDGKPVGRVPVEAQLGLGAALAAESPGYGRMEARVPEAAEDPYEFRFELLPAGDHDLASAPDTLQLQGGMAMKKFLGGKVERHLYGALEGDRQPAQDTMAPPFYLATTEVTRGFYNKVLGRPAPPAVEARLPVTGLTWRQAAEFANAVSKAEGLPPFYQFVESQGVKSIEYSPGAAGYRLPTESEWLHAAKLAARAVNPGAAIAYWGEAAEIPRGQGNFAGREARDQAGWDFLPAYVDRHLGLAPAGSYRAHAGGVHDLDGNAAEWLHNYAGAQPKGQPFDIFGPGRGLLRLVKGGSYRTASRQGLEIRHVRGELYASETIGFRLARSL